MARFFVLLLNTKFYDNFALVKMTSKISYRFGVWLIKIGCGLVRRSGNFSEDEKKTLTYHGVRHLSGVTVHYDDGFLSEPYPMTILIP